MEFFSSITNAYMYLKSQKEHERNLNRPQNSKSRCNQPIPTTYHSNDNYLDLLKDTDQYESIKRINALYYKSTIK